MLKAVIKKRAYEDIVEQIQNLIREGKLKKGDQLPNERELSETFKVSRATVRDAILSLETMKLVDRRQGDGTYVIDSEEALVQPLAASLFHERDDLIDIFAIRKIFEPEVARLASNNRTPEEMVELEKILEKQQKEVAARENIVQSDTEFHHLLARMTQNRALERLQVTLFDVLAKTRQEYLQSEERKEKSLRGHEAILTAVKTGDVRAARKAMQRHLEDVESILFKNRKGGGKPS